MHNNRPSSSATTPPVFVASYPIREPQRTASKELQSIPMRLKGSRQPKATHPSVQASMTFIPFVFLFVGLAFFSALALALRITKTTARPRQRLIMSRPFFRPAFEWSFIRKRWTGSLPHHDSLARSRLRFSPPDGGNRLTPTTPRWGHCPWDIKL
jgi:hypothetical protein